MVNIAPIRVGEMAGTVEQSAIPAGQTMVSFLKQCQAYYKWELFGVLPKQNNSDRNLIYSKVFKAKMMVKLPYK